MQPKEQDLIKLIEKKGDNADLVLLDKIHDVEAEVERIKEDVSQLGEVKEEEPNAQMERLATKLIAKFAVLEKGEKGDKGDTGESIKGEQGEPGRDGVDGKDGKDGRDGIDGINGTDGKDGTNGKDADEETVIQKIEQDLPKLGERIRDGLELLNGDARLKQEAIDGLVEKLKELEERFARIPTGRIGGGVTDLAVTYSIGRIVKKETPTGAINGSNTSYTVTQQVHAVISLVINGEHITDNEYTVAGNTITMTTALPSALSGTSFRIVYV